MLIELSMVPSTVLCLQLNLYRFSVENNSLPSSDQYFRYIEEMCWAIESLKKTNKPIVAMMNIGGMGDRTGISTADCALKMADAGMPMSAFFR